MSTDSLEGLSFSEKTLLLDFETSSLEAYRWDTLDPLTGATTFIFVFYGDMIRLIKLDKTDPVVRFVKSKTHETKVQILTDEDVAMYSEDASEFLKQRQEAQV